MCHFLVFLALPEGGNVDKVTLMQGWGRIAGVCVAVAALCPVVRAGTVPAGTLIEIRLQQEINSHSTEAGAAFQGLVVSPVAEVGGRELIPAGSVARGTVEHVKRVGLGLVRERASIGLRVSTIELPDGRVLSVPNEVVELENAREAVDKRGRIRGIRSTDTPGYRGTGLLVSLTAVEPMAMMFSSTVFATVLRFSEPEIRLTPGAEIRVRVTEPVEAGEGFAPAVSAVTRNAEERRMLFSMVPRMAYRTKTPLGSDSDFTNLVFVGEQEAVSRAFEAAGWHVPETVTAATRYRTLRAVAESQAYQRAPMSVLTLDGKVPVLNRTKALNSFARRHHIRIFETGERWYGEPVFTAASTQDSGIGFSMKEKAFVHLIDPLIDRERGKVFDDLAMTGCVTGAELVPRPWLPKDAKNATGDRLITDGNVLVVRLNACEQPRRADEEVAPSPGPYRGNAVMRASRRFFLTARNDLVRGNVVYQGIAYSAAGFKLMRRAPGKTGAEEEDRVTPVREDFALREEEMQRVRMLPDPPLVDVSPLPMVASSFAPRNDRPAAGRGREDAWAPPHMELSFQMGQCVFGAPTLGGEGLRITYRTADGEHRHVQVFAENAMRPKWQIGGALTVNAHRWVSHEIGFQYLRASYEPNLSSSEPMTAATIKRDFKDQPAGLLTRQLTYNTVIHLRPRESRWSPYLAVGPGLSLMNLTDAPFQKARGVFRLGLANVGMLQASYNFGQVAPLEGGGVFQPILQYGAGFKVRVRPRWTYRVDFRTGLMGHPNFVSRSLVKDPGVLEPGGPARIEAMEGLRRGVLQQKRFSSGFAFTF